MLRVSATSAAALRSRRACASLCTKGCRDKRYRRRGLGLRVSSLREWSVVLANGGASDAPKQPAGHRRRPGRAGIARAVS